ncbi:hypothetical protein MATR_21340 [Marivirga tractuosa]|uniref:Uncharacterized protein n=1 Tax=Marivirga tractuosa (strain ATCC 23168 / DSM 4126 / NBRC 15989 / NCIMB 1408 / VKM B-1430 / H-43) TaxID=643867 RepID=E4TLB2_MARTH|nr:hypothetical protein Ftrac_0239 [Marivirga tractuosa DSM 4126]BDD15309.1 hypothetical protein MATR_21340 [Marivirga tractuosa]
MLSGVEFKKQKKAARSPPDGYISTKTLQSH